MFWKNVLHFFLQNIGPYLPHTQHHIPKEHNLNKYCCQNPKLKKKKTAYDINISIH